MRAVYALHAVSWLAILIAIIGLFHSLLITGVAAAIAAAAWTAEDIVRRLT